MIMRPATTIRRGIEVERAETLVDCYSVPTLLSIGKMLMNAADI